MDRARMKSRDESIRKFRDAMVNLEVEYQRIASQIFGVGAVAAVSGPDCCSAITGRLFQDQAMLNTLLSLPPNPAIEDAINYLYGATDNARHNQGFCC